MILQQFQTLAAYNQKMNQQFYLACATLTGDELKKNREVFFKSIFGTLNHMLLTDRLWLGGFTENPVVFSALDEELYADFDELRAGRRKTDADIREWVAGLTEDWLKESFSKGLDFPRWLAVTHFFNHQAHHRGQLSAMMSQCGLDYGTTDMPWVEGMASLAAATV